MFKAQRVRQAYTAASSWLVRVLKSPYLFLYAYAAAGGIVIGLAIWWLSPLIRPADNFSALVFREGVRPVSYTTPARWYLEKIPNPEALTSMN